MASFFKTSVAFSKHTNYSSNNNSLHETDERDVIEVDNIDGVGLLKNPLDKKAKKDK